MINNIALYRNNSTSLNKETDEERQGNYYVPDYIIKYSEGTEESYIICDAKFSRKDNVRHRIIPGLIYKYITSISTSEPNAKIKGLFVFYGLEQNESNMESFYDNQLSTTKPIEPRIEMVPLSETMPYSDQSNNAMKMLQCVMNVVGR